MGCGCGLPSARAGVELAGAHRAALAGGGEPGDERRVPEVESEELGVVLGSARPERLRPQEGADVGRVEEAVLGADELAHVVVEHALGVLRPTVLFTPAELAVLLEVVPERLALGGELAEDAQGGLGEGLSEDQEAHGERQDPLGRARDHGLDRLERRRGGDGLDHGKAPRR